MLYKAHSYSEGDNLAFSDCPLYEHFVREKFGRLISESSRLVEKYIGGTRAEMHRFSTSSEDW